MLEIAEMTRKSFRTLAIHFGTRAKATTRVYKRSLEIGIVDARRMRSGIGSDGVVIMMEGMPRRRVAAFSTGRVMKEKGDRDESVSGSFGLAENRISGNVRRIAMDTERADNMLNDRVLDVLAVVIG